MSTTSQMRKLIIELRKTPNEIGVAILAERLMTISHMTRKKLTANPRYFNTSITNKQMYLDLCNLIDKYFPPTSKPNN